jgi:DNA-binding MarR family transcriptional regulator
MASPSRALIPEEGPLLHRTPAGDVLFLLLRGHRVVSDGVDRALRETGLSLALWEVLVILTSAPGMRLRMADITQRMLVSKSNVSKLTDRLEAAGMIERETSRSDRRVVYASLTQAGKQAVKRGADLFNDGARQYIAKHLTAAELRAMRSGLLKVLAAAIPT